MSSIAHYKDLVFYRTWADLRSESQRYYLNFIWWLLTPTLEMFVYYIVFGLGLRGMRTEHFVPFLLIGIITWRWFDITVKQCTSSIQGSRAMVQQVSMPKIVFPLIVVCRDSFKFLIAFFIIVVFVNIYGLIVSFTYVSIPIILFVQFLLIMAVGILFACFTPFFPDFALLVGYPIRMVFFMSGIFYDISKITGKHIYLFTYNPMAQLIQSYREVLLYKRWPDFNVLLVIALASILTLCLGIWLIFKLDKTIPKALAR